uniref:Nucleotide-diphospho-sugar transferase domain-containing protein n=1 Tax=viral metagenome TaxID=1070528 RepID=A0A6C0ER40_9ZZZZ
MDFVIPLHRYHNMVRTTVEAIHTFYSPRNIFIITPEIYVSNIEYSSIYWLGNVIVIPEETFFMKNYGLHKRDIENMFNNQPNHRSREFGWWYQQIIKLAGYTQISGLSDPYVVWDSDLIPLVKWSIYPHIGETQYKIAILQEKARSEWNMEQYKDSMIHLTGLTPVEPEEGTFVPHHFVLHHCVLEQLHNHIENYGTRYNNNIGMNWIHCIMELSHMFFRFSEYKMIATFMTKYFPEMLKYHKFKKYGKFGYRLRDPVPFIKEVEENCVIENCGLSYEEFCRFVNQYYGHKISYLQIEHI